MNRQPTPREADATQRNLTTADLAAAAEHLPEEQRRLPNDQVPSQPSRDERRGDELAPLFSPDVANDFHSRWEQVQSGFVDDPRQAVRRGDELVAQVMKSLADSFATERSKLESQIGQQDAASTESLRVAFRRYRSFFERLLSV